MASGTAMRLSYLPANQAFAFVMGDDIIRLEDESLFFRSRAQAKQAASRHGLDVDGRGLVTPRHHDYDPAPLDGYGQRRIPSKKKLYEVLSGVMRDYVSDINMIRHLLVDWRDGQISTDHMLDEANGLLRGHGVESLQSEDGVARAYYINMGDTYTPTLLLDLGRDRVFATDWGSWVEAEEKAGHRF